VFEAAGGIDGMRRLAAAWHRHVGCTGPYRKISSSSVKYYACSTMRVNGPLPDMGPSHTATSGLPYSRALPLLGAVLT
jgi:hypothetical protein